MPTALASWFKSIVIPSLESCITSRMRAAWAAPRDSARAARPLTTSSGTKTAPSSVIADCSWSGVGAAWTVRKSCANRVTSSGEQVESDERQFGSVGSTMCSPKWCAKAPSQKIMTRTVPGCRLPVVE